MPFTITQRESANPDEWAIAIATCDLGDNNDNLLTTTVDLVRKSYGEHALMADAEAMMEDDILDSTFNLEHLRTAIREGLPDPQMEGNKPQQLTNYRSQSAEMVAKAALSKTYGYKYPVAPQEGSVNPNQPILGFDGWGILGDSDGDVCLALIQVKATDANASPPAEAGKLAQECRRAPTGRSAICRALAVLCRLLRGDPLQAAVLRMLASIGTGDPIFFLVSPAIVRGTTTARQTDLDPIMVIADDIRPAAIRAIVVSIGVCLNQFGHLVMCKAREAS